MSGVMVGSLDWEMSVENIRANFQQAKDELELVEGIGELVTATVATGSAVSLSTNTAKTVTSIALTAGTWLVSGVVDFKPAASTSMTKLQAGASLTTDAVETQAGGAGLGTDPLVTQNMAAMVPAADYGVAFGPVPLVLAANATVYLTALAVFTVSTMGAYGSIHAVRIAPAA